MIAGVREACLPRPHTHVQTKRGPQFPTPCHKTKTANSPKTLTSAVGRITFDGHRDGRVLADQIATGKQLGGLRGVAALDFPNAVAQNTV